MPSTLICVETAVIRHYNIGNLSALSRTIQETALLYQQVQDEQAALTEEERQAEAVENQAQIRKILAKAEASEKRTRYLSIPFRHTLFSRLVKLAIKYAEDACVDISYETKDAHPHYRILLTGGVNMELEYIRQRITELRLKKGVSEYKMSLDLGHS